MSAENEYFLVGVEQSQYAHKVRAFFRNNAIPFKDVSAEPKIFKTVILPNAPYPLIPDLIVVSKETKKFQVVWDSKLIMEYISKTHGIPGVVGVKRAFVDMLLEAAIDDFFYLSIMPWRFNEPKHRKYLEYTFGDISLPLEKARERGTRMMGAVGGRTASLGLTPKTLPVWKQKLQTFFELLHQQLEKYQFLMGNHPSKIDYTVYGLLQATLMKDPVPYERFVTEYPVVHAYMGRVGGTSVRWGSVDHVELDIEGDKVASFESTMGKSKGGPDVESNDGIPEAITKIGAMIMKDYVTVLEPTVKATLEFLNAQGGKDEIVIPRIIKGEYEFSMFGNDGSEVREKKVVTTHCVWMIQRMLDSTYMPDKRAEADRWLGEIGCLDKWKAIIKLWEESGWRIEMKRQGTVAYKQPSPSKL